MPLCVFHVFQRLKMPVANLSVPQQKGKKKKLRRCSATLCKEESWIHQLNRTYELIEKQYSGLRIGIVDK